MIRSKLGYLVILIFFGLFALLYDEYMTLIIFLVMLMIPIVLWICGFYLKRCVDMQIETESLIQNKGQAFNVILRFRNRSVLPVSKVKFILKYRNMFDSQSGTQTIMTALDSKSDTVLSLSVSSDYCGMMEFTVGRIMIYDYLGLWQFRKKVQIRAEVSILPALWVIEGKFVIDNPNVLVDSELFSNSKSGDDPSEIYGLRNYEAGDKMNRIHWKLSMKQDELMVKQFGLPINCAVAIFVDFYHLGSEQEMQTADAILETVLSLSISMVLQGQIHFILWNDEEKETCHKERIEKEEDVYEVLARLFRLKITQTRQSMLSFVQAQYEREEFTNLFYVCTGFTSNEAQQLEAMKKSAITHILTIEPGSGSIIEKTDQAMRLAQAMQMQAVVIRTDHLGQDIMNFGIDQD